MLNNSLHYGLQLISEEALVFSIFIHLPKFSQNFSETFILTKLIQRNGSGLLIGKNTFYTFYYLPIVTSCARVLGTAQ